MILPGEVTTVTPPTISYTTARQSRHEKALVSCLQRFLARCIEVLRQFDFPLKGRSETV